MNVLIVDDDPLMAKTLSDILSYRGHQTVVAHSGQEALERVKAASFDCVLSDIRMPSIDGVQLHKALKAVLGELPTALMTAYADAASMRAGLEAGAVAVFTKPINLDMLLLFVQSIPDHLDEFARVAYSQAIGSVITPADLTGTTRSFGVLP